MQKFEPPVIHHDLKPGNVVYTRDSTGSIHIQIIDWGAHTFATEGKRKGIVDLLINWSTSELNTLLDPTTYLDYTDSWIQLVIAPTMAVTSWIQLSTCILNSNWTGGASPPSASRW